MLSSISGLREGDSKPSYHFFFIIVNGLPTTLLLTDLGLLGGFMQGIFQTKSFFFFLKFLNFKNTQHIF